MVEDVPGAATGFLRIGTFNVKKMVFFWRRQRDSSTMDPRTETTGMEEGIKTETDDLEGRRAEEDSTETNPTFFEARCTVQWYVFQVLLSIFPFYNQLKSAGNNDGRS